MVFDQKTIDLSAVDDNLVTEADIDDLDTTDSSTTYVNVLVRQLTT